MEQAPNNNERPLSPEDRLLEKIKGQQTPEFEQALHTHEIIGKLGHNTDDHGPEDELRIEKDQDDTVNWVLNNFNQKANIAETNIVKVEKMIEGLRKKIDDLRETHRILISKKDEILAGQTENTAEDLERYAATLIDTVDFNTKFIARLEQQIESNRTFLNKVKLPDWSNPSSN